SCKTNPSSRPSANLRASRRPASNHCALRESQTGLASYSPCRPRAPRPLRRAANAALPAQWPPSRSRKAGSPSPQALRTSIPPSDRHDAHHTRRRRWSASRCRKSRDRSRKHPRGSGDFLLGRRALTTQPHSQRKPIGWGAPSVPPPPPQSLHPSETYFSSLPAACQHRSLFYRRSAKLENGGWRFVAVFAIACGASYPRRRYKPNPTKLKTEPAPWDRRTGGRDMKNCAALLGAFALAVASPAFAQRPESRGESRPEAHGQREPNAPGANQVSATVAETRATHPARIRAAL